jgi:glutathione peroxidase-family protein
LKFLDFTRNFFKLYYLFQLYKDYGRSSIQYVWVNNFTKKKLPMSKKDIGRCTSELLDLSFYCTIKIMVEVNNSIKIFNDFHEIEN